MKKCSADYCDRLRRPLKVAHVRETYRHETRALTSRSRSSCLFFFCCIRLIPSFKVTTFFYRRFWPYTGSARTAAIVAARKAQASVPPPTDYEKGKERDRWEQDCSFFLSVPSIPFAFHGSLELPAFKFFSASVPGMQKAAQPKRSRKKEGACKKKSRNLNTFCVTSPAPGQNPLFPLFQRHVHEHQVQHPHRGHHLKPERRRAQQEEGGLQVEEGPGRVSLINTTFKFAQT